ncbi:MAG TPA: hypothetical protein EYO61_04405 [Campylobacterales bacterium]|nr:hypothetical protein [Campylobacterales bacterium]
MEIAIDGIIDLNLAPKDGKISLNSLQELSQLASKSGVVGFALSDIDSDLQLTLLESIASKIENISIFPIISGVKENRLVEIASLIDRAYAIYITSDINQNLMRRVFEYAKMKRKPIICKIQNRELDSDGVVYDNENAFYFGLPTRHLIGERIGVAIVKEMSRYFGVPTLLQGVTDREALNLAIEGKKEGIPLYIEISIHHLIFDDSIYWKFDNYFKIDPPFQSKNGKEFLIELLRNGDIDMITSLHHPISESEKSGSFIDSKYGVLGLEGIASIYYSTLVESGYIDLERLQDITSRNQRRFLNIEMDRKVKLDISQHIEIENKNSLYHGKKFKGNIKI